MDGGGEEEEERRKKKRDVLVEKLLKKKEEEEVAAVEAEEAVVLDGSDIRELVENKEALSDYVDSKFRELDINRDGKLSVEELRPAVADIAAAVGLPVQGSSPDSDNIYSEVLNEFTQGKQEEVSKTEFKEVLSDILSGMAAGLKKDPVVILRIDGEELNEFVESPGFDQEAIDIYSLLELPDSPPLREFVTMALEHLTVDHGMPPSTDSWVFHKIVEPAMCSVSTNRTEKPVSQESFLVEFKKIVKSVTQKLKEHPVIVAHSENTFDGGEIKRLMSNKFELDKLLDRAWRDYLSKDNNQISSMEFLRGTLDSISPSSGLPPYGVVDQVDGIINEAIKIAADDGKTFSEEEFKNMVTDVLGNIMLKLEENPISVSSNSVVHEHFASSTTVSEPSPLSSTETQIE